MEDKQGKEMLEFIGGIVMCIAGLLLFCNRVTVTSGWGMGRISFWGLLGNGVPSGMIVIPLIIGIVIMFVIPRSIVGKIVTAAGALIIIVSIIESTRLIFIGANLFEYILMLVLIFGGAALVLKVAMFGPASNRGHNSSAHKSKNNSTHTSESDSVSDELEDIKKKYR